jgi:very-short-patch-repair endonuclease
MGEGWGGGESFLVDNLLNLAKSLRKRPTDAEKRLWLHLKSKQINGLKFRRQEPIGTYIVDFVCFEQRLIIELDGGQHAGQQAQDQERESWFRSQGFKTLRFWNHEVLANIEGVLEVIRGTCLTTPSPNPSHQGRGINKD